MTSQRKTFSIYQEPHEAVVGEHTFLFKPEIYADESLDAWVQLRAALDTIREKYGAPSETIDANGNSTLDPAQVKARNTEINEANRAFVASHMMPESRDEYMDARLPERVNLELQQWIAEVYGGRPTTSSSGS